MEIYVSLRTYGCPLLVPEAADPLADDPNEFHEVLSEGRVEKDVEDHVGRRVDHEHEVADARHDCRPTREVLLVMRLQNININVQCDCVTRQKGKTFR